MGEEWRLGSWGAEGVCSGVGEDGVEREYKGREKVKLV